MPDTDKVFRKELASPGFVKTSAPAVELDRAQRSALIRKGNELFNHGAVDQAKRIFITTKYSDGLIRVGDYHLKRNEHLEAFRMYWLAPDRRKSDALIERMAAVVRGWIEEPEGE